MIFDKIRAYFTDKTCISYGKRVISVKFTYYVLNYNHNAQKVEPFNIFCNISVQEYTEKEVEKYLYSPKNYVYKSFDGQEEIYGFNGLVKEIDNIIRWEEWSRCGYEMGVCYKFETDCKNIAHMDCYEQAHMNIEMIVREVIRQYKQYVRAKKIRSKIYGTEEIYGYFQN